MRGIRSRRLVFASATLAVAVLAWSQSRGQHVPAAAGALVLGQGLQEETDRPVYRSGPITAATARTWLALHEPLAMPFTVETPLSDVLKYIQSSIKSKDLPHGLQIYVDPAGLLEAEKTMESTVVLNVEGVPLANSLQLLLKQLDLTYYVRQDGLVVITYIASADLVSYDPDTMAYVVNQLQAQVQQLRHELHGGRGRTTHPAPQFRVRTSSGFQ